MRTLIIALTLLSITACGPKLPPNTSVEANVAVRGTQVVTALRATIPAIKLFVCQPGVAEPCLKTADALKVFGALETAGRTAEQLATTLAAVDAAKTVTEKSSGMEKARALLVSLQSMLTTVSVGPAEEQIRQRLVTTFATVTQLLFAVSTF